MLNITGNLGNNACLHRGLRFQRGAVRRSGGISVRDIGIFYAQNAFASCRHGSRFRPWVYNGGEPEEGFDIDERQLSQSIPEFVHNDRAHRDSVGVDHAAARAPVHEERESAEDVLSRS